MNEYQYKNGDKDPDAVYAYADMNKEKENTIDF
jgi:hypothetical protein